MTCVLRCATMHGTGGDRMYKLYEISWYEAGEKSREYHHARVVAYGFVEAVSAFQAAHPDVLEFTVKLGGTEFLGVYVGAQS